MKAWKGRDDERELVARMHAKGRVTARVMVADAESKMPRGYSLIMESIKKERRTGRRTGSAGSVVTVTMVILHTDSREPELHPHDLEDLWAGVETDAVAAA